MSFSEIPWEFSLACPFSITLRVSKTEIDPWMVKVLFFCWLAYEAWASSSHEQQFDWQIWENWVSGTDDRNSDCLASASVLNPLFKPAPKPGSWVKLQGHWGRSTEGSSVIPPEHQSPEPPLLPPDEEPPDSYARFIAFFCPSLCLTEVDAKAPAKRAIRITVFLANIVILVLIYK